MSERDADAIIDLVSEAANESGLHTDSLIVDESKAFTLSLWSKQGSRPDSRMLMLAVVNWCRKDPNKIHIKSPRGSSIDINIANPNCAQLLRSYMDSLAEGDTDFCKRSPSRPWCDHDDCKNY